MFPLPYNYLFDIFRLKTVARTLKAICKHDLVFQEIVISKAIL